MVSDDERRIPLLLRTLGAVALFMFIVLGVILTYFILHLEEATVQNRQILRHEHKQIELILCSSLEPDDVLATTICDDVAQYWRERDTS